MEPSTIKPIPCRRCGQSVKIPTPSDTLCGRPGAPRRRAYPEYNAPIPLLPPPGNTAPDHQNAYDKNQEQRQLDAGIPQLSQRIQQNEDVRFYQPPTIFQLNPDDNQRVQPPTQSETPVPVIGGKGVGARPGSVRPPPPLGPSTGRSETPPPPPVNERPLPPTSKEPSGNHGYSQFSSPSVSLVDMSPVLTTKRDGPREISIRAIVSNVGAGPKVPVRRQESRLPHNSQPPKRAPPKRSSTVGRMSIGTAPEEENRDDELRQYAFIGYKDCKPDYGTGHVIRGEKALLEWRDYPIYDMQWGGKSEDDNRSFRLMG